MREISMETALRYVRRFPVATVERYIGVVDLELDIYLMLNNQIIARIVLPPVNHELERDFVILSLANEAMHRPRSPQTRPCSICNDNPCCCLA